MDRNERLKNIIKYHKANLTNYRVCFKTLHMTTYMCCTIKKCCVDTVNFGCESMPWLRPSYHILNILYFITYFQNVFIKFSLSHMICLLEVKFWKNYLRSGTENRPETLPSPKQHFRWFCWKKSKDIFQNVFLKSS